MNWNVYLSGEIHTDWRDRIQENANRANLAITFMTSNVWNFNSQSVCMYDEFALAISLQLILPGE